MTRRQKQVAGAAAAAGGIGAAYLGRKKIAGGAKALMKTRFGRAAGKKAKAAYGGLKNLGGKAKGLFGKGKKGKKK